MGYNYYYSDDAYRKRQSEITKQKWKEGLHDSLRKKVPHTCKREGCGKTFTTKPSDPKVYCSRACAGSVNNRGRIMSTGTRTKISAALNGRTYPERKAAYRIKFPPKYGICLNPDCKKSFLLKYWRPVHNPIKYCSRSCAIRDIGSRPTSPKAARAKAGIRPDIDPKIYFFSRWEANFARILNLLKIKWIHQPGRFRLKDQYYTPDFYLPEIDTYIEIKNFLSDYSARRDREFRELYPNEKLILVLKPDYTDLQTAYAPRIKNWEFS